MISANFGWSKLPLDEAIAYFAQKQNVDTDSWRDVQGHAHQAAFVVAGAKASILQDFRSAVDKALSQGTDLAEFRRDFDKTVAARGWDYTGGRDWRTDLIFQTNLRTAYGAGRREQMERTKSRRPYRQWRHAGSADPRPEHLAMDGVVVRADSEIAQRSLPHGYGCKCTWFTLSDRDLDRLGLEVKEVAAAAIPVDTGWAATPAPAADGPAAALSRTLATAQPDIAEQVNIDTSVQDAIAALAAGPTREAALSDEQLAEAGVTDTEIDSILSDPEQVELLRMAITALRTGEPPPLNEIKGVFSGIGKAFIRNPIATIQAGKARDLG